ncbi:phytanoyl-CoA dioxygenase family protein [Acanthopleuribacter pedis]|uniref:Phytanoyl-CoA dioxygenase family protein n=1 Tax=Acanthopleuribacter pedis TaxID=442870 RepID=A0A8J7QFF5_9BACT|nr:phytanoyl-CoA dioxygenase family protein [Acanthopleuribacter pedis]MBO1323104.1 phytanoyl-CoA dioxygenase family protein [Acanthopleuribacter pedis]
MLTQAQRETYQNQGYLVLPDFLTPALCARLRAAAAAQVAAFEPGDHVSVFSTQADKQDRDQYFLDSATRIHFFFEEEAFDAAGRPTVPKNQAINKIGHALHYLDPDFKTLSDDPRLFEIAAALAYREPKLLQSMYIFKQPGIGGEVTCHQDSTFLYTEPHSVMGFWFALEDATLENGCLWALPGHHRGPLKSRYIRKPEGGTGFITYDDTPWPQEGLVPLPVSEGTLVLLHGSLPHLSYANRSPKSRHAYAVHMIDGACRYPAENWLQPE